ncbi:unnamed protein product [Malus baccata var. baccata]
MIDFHKKSDDRFVDWRGKEANPKKYLGIAAAALTCVVGVLINMVFLSNAINFVSYFRLSMHYLPATSANMVTNFMGTSFLLSIVGGFICDSLLTSFTTFIIFFGLYVFAAGIAGLNVALRAHGANQLDHNDARLISAFFNCSTVMVWVEDHIGCNWSFLLTVIALSLSLVIFIIGTPFYRHKVLAYAARNWKPSSNKRVGNQRAVSSINPNRADGQSYDKLKFLDKTLTDSTISAAQVKETRTFIGLLSIFASTIMMNCCIAQLQTRSVVQGTNAIALGFVNRKINNFEIPVQSLGIFPLSVMLASIPLYEQFQRRSRILFPPILIPFPPLLSLIAFSAIIETKRREAAHKNATLSFFWLGWQYLFLGVSDMLTLGGMLEFFYSEAPGSMRSISTSLAWCSTSMGYFLSSVLASIANSVSGRFGKEWLGGADVNHSRLDLFYTLLCILNTLNVLNYIDWARKY